MKYYSKLNVYKNSTGSNKFDPATMTAKSYNWWTYFKVINGVAVFNEYFYSPTTSKHQSRLRSLLHQLGISINLVIEAPKGLNDLDSAKQHYIDLINANTNRIKKKGTHKQTKINLTEFNEQLKLKIKTINDLTRGEISA